MPFERAVPKSPPILLACAVGALALFGYAVTGCPPDPGGSGNATPVADAGPDQTVLVGETVTLDGSGSLDLDGDPLTYSWSITSRPPGSSADFTDPTATMPSFVVDVPGVYEVELIVSDGVEDSLPDTVVVSTENSAPVADAGSDQSVLVGETVTLDGTGSSDADGDLLSHLWSFESVPAGSLAELSDPTLVTPTFIVDEPGEYVVQLVVDDGTDESAPDTVTITTANSAPVAEAGADQTVLVGDTVTLDGSGSTDVDGDAISFAWALTDLPSGSAATLSDSAAISPSFDVDLPGTYVAELIVNDGTAGSAPDTVAITTQNSAPVADAGPDQSVFTGDTVTLDGGGSSDVDGDPLSFFWSLLSVPFDSAAVLSDSAVEMPTFVADVFGNYVVQLSVNDGAVSSAPDSVTISTENSAPVAHAGDDQTVFVGDTVTLDGSGSGDGDGDPLTYEWALTSVPAGSAAALSDVGDVSPSLVVDRPGTYVAQLIVNDGTVDSAPDTVTVEATDDEAPVVTVPDDITESAVDANGATVTYADAAAVDNVDGALTASCTPTSGSQFALGDTTVTCTATDAAGNTGSASFTVTVVDDADPLVTVSANVTESAVDASGATVTYADATAVDNVDGALTAPCTPASGSQFALGDTTVTCTATDAAGNTGSASFTVSMVDDAAPVLAQPDAINVDTNDPAGIVVSFTDPSATDNVDGAVTVSCSPTSGSLFAVGDTTVDCTADDVAGNTGSVSFVVRVVLNNAPIADAGPDQDAVINQTVTLDGSGSSDPDDDLFTYAWTLTPPGGSTATLDDPTSETPSFVADQPGLYTAALVVTDDGGLQSPADSVDITVRIGGLDLSFGTGGCFTWDRAGERDFGVDVVMSNGQALIAGASELSSANRSPTVWSVIGDGELYTELGFGGWTENSEPIPFSSLEHAFDVTVDSDGRILALGGGRLGDANVRVGLLWRFLPNGGVDAAFGGPDPGNFNSGIGFVEVDGFDNDNLDVTSDVRTGLIDGQERVAVAQSARLSAAQGFYGSLWVLNLDGSPYAGFDGNNNTLVAPVGTQVITGAPGNLLVLDNPKDGTLFHDVEIIDNGLVIAGHTNNGGDAQVHLVTYRRALGDGGLDPDFALNEPLCSSSIVGRTDPEVLTAAALCMGAPGEDTTHAAMTPDGQGRLVTASAVHIVDTDNWDIRFCRLTVDGHPDRDGFGTDTGANDWCTTVDGGGDEFVTNVTVMPDGHIIASGFGPNPADGLNDPLIWMLTPAGELYDGFGAGGTLRLESPIDDGSQGLTLQTPWAALVTGWATPDPARPREDLLVCRILLASPPPVTNLRPVAATGLDQDVTVGDTVTLDGLGSSDPEEAPITYEWRLFKPDGSTELLSGASPSFDPTMGGSYLAQLIVDDGNADDETRLSLPAFTVVRVNTPPVADIALSATETVVGTAVTLDGSGSFDADGDSLTWAWTLVSQPGGSAATIADTTAEVTSLTVDVLGDFVIELVVNDGKIDSATASDTVTAVLPRIFLALIGTDLVGQARTARLGVTLESPAPAGGALVAIASDDLAVLTVEPPGSVLFAEGETFGEIVVNGISGAATPPPPDGEALVTAQTTGYTDGTLNVGVTRNLVSTDATLTIPPGQSRQLAISVVIDAAADPRPADLSVTSSDDSVIQVLTPTVTIGAGENAANADVIAPNGFGSATITVRHPLFAGSSTLVTATGTIEIDRPVQNFDHDQQGAMIVQLVSDGEVFAAPEDVVFDVTSDNPDCISVSAQATIQSGNVNEPVPLTWGGNALPPCSATISIDHLELGSDSALFDVREGGEPPLSLSWRNRAPGPFIGPVGANLQRRVQVDLNRIPGVPVSVTIQSDDPSVALVAVDRFDAGQASIQLDFLASQRGKVLYIQGVSPGSTTIRTISSVVDATLNQQIPASAVRLHSVRNQFDLFDVNDVANVRVGIPSGATVSPVQQVRGGIGSLPFTVETDSGTSIVSLDNLSGSTGETITVSITSGFDRRNFEIDPVGVGITDLTVSGNGFLQVGDSIETVEVEAAFINVQDAISGPTVCLGCNSRTTRFDLSGVRHGGLTVRAESLDPSCLTVSDAESVEGTAFFDFTLADGVARDDFVVHAMEGTGCLGSVGVHVYVPADSSVVDFTKTFVILPPAVHISALSTTRGTLAGVDPFTCRLGVNSGGNNVTPQLRARPGGPGVECEVTSTDPAVGALTTSTVPFPGAATVTVLVPPGQFKSSETVAGGGVAFVPLAEGQTTIQSRTPNGSTVGNSDRTVDVTAPVVEPPNDPTNIDTSVGVGRISRSLRWSLSDSAHGGVFFEVCSPDENVLVFSLDTSTPGTACAGRLVDDGERFLDVYAQGVPGALADGVNVTSLTVTGSADLFTDGTQTMWVRRPAMRINRINTARRVFQTDDQFGCQSGVSIDGYVTVWQNQNIGPLGSPLIPRFSVYDATGTVLDDSVITLVAENPPGTVVVGSSVTGRIPTGQSGTPAPLASGGVAARAQTAGTAIIRVSEDNDLALPVTNGGEVTVTQPAITVSDSLIGDGLQADRGATLGATEHGGRTVRVESSNPSIVLVAPDGVSGPGQSFLDVFVPDGQSIVDFWLRGVEGASGTVQITVSADGFLQGVASAEVAAGVVRIRGLGNGYESGAIDPFRVEVGVLSNAQFVRQPVSADTGTLDITVTSSDGSRGLLVIDDVPGTGQTLTLDINEGITEQSAAQGGIVFHAIDAGAVSVEATAPGFDPFENTVNMLVSQTGTYYWDIGAFDPCGVVSCGDATRTRTVECRQTADDAVVADASCDTEDGNKPATALSCGNCQNGGTCNAGICECLAGSSGDLCETNIGFPTIVSRETADSDGDGQIDRIRIVLSEPIDDATVLASDFDVVGYTGEAFWSGAAYDNELFISFAESGTRDTDATPALEYTQGTLADLGGNRLASDGAPVASVDRASPVLVRAQASGVGLTTVTLTFSEPVDSAQDGVLSGDLVDADFVYDDASNGDAAAAVVGGDANAIDEVMTLETDVAVTANDIGVDAVGPAANAIFDGADNAALTTPAILAPPE